MVRLKCSVFTSYVRAPATFFPAQQDRVQVARAERRWNTIVEHGITNVGVSNNARSTVVAATGELEIQGGSARCTVLNRWCIDISLSVQRRFLFFPLLRERWSVDFVAGYLDAILKWPLCDSSRFFTERLEWRTVSRIVCSSEGGSVLKVDPFAARFLIGLSIEVDSSGSLCDVEEEGYFCTAW